MNEIQTIKTDYHLAVAEARYNKIQDHYNGKDNNKLTADNHAKLYEHYSII